MFHGTLEYFSEDDINKMLKILKEKSANFIFALKEPSNIDLDKTKHSKPRGNIAYSHNYPYLIKNAGLKIEVLKVEPINQKIANYNNITLVATYKR